MKATVLSVSAMPPPRWTVEGAIAIKVSRAEAVSDLGSALWLGDPRVCLILINQTQRRTSILQLSLRRHGFSAEGYT
jgi:hypothetical protein